MSNRIEPLVTLRAADADAEALRRSARLLQVWLSPSFPIGAYAYSHGLEKAVERGWVRDRATLEPWLRDLIGLGGLGNDLIFLASVWRAASEGAWAKVKEIAQLAAALQPSAERYLEATQQGQSFIAQIDAAWTHPAPAWRDATEDATPTLAVALGFAAARHEVPLRLALDAYALAFVGAQTSAAIRLSVIGQTEAQMVTAALTPDLAAAVDRAGQATLDDLGSAVWSADLVSLQHETQQTRLFRS